MKLSVIRIAFITILSLGVSALSGCDGKVSKDDASKAGEILKKWQDQNRK